MGQNGVQKGARPLKTCLQAPQSIHFWSQTHLRCTEMGGEAPGPDLCMPKSALCEIPHSCILLAKQRFMRNPLFLHIACQTVICAKSPIPVHCMPNSDGEGALPLKTCLQAPQSIHFWSQTHFRCTGMGWEAPGPDL